MGFKTKLLLALIVPPHAVGLLCRAPVCSPKPTKLFSNNQDDDDKTSGDKKKIDVVKSVGEFMGYPEEQKWKGTRIFLYSIVGGMLVSELVHEATRGPELVDWFN